MQEEGGMVTTLREAVMSRPTIAAMGQTDAAVPACLSINASSLAAGALLYPQTEVDHV